MISIAGLKSPVLPSLGRTSGFEKFVCAVSEKTSNVVYILVCRISVLVAKASFFFVREPVFIVIIAHRCFFCSKQNRNICDLVLQYYNISLITNKYLNRNTVR